MSVTIDDQPLATKELGLRTVGQVLAHVQKDNRLVVHVLIDGAEPDWDQMSSVRQSALDGHTLYVETVDPRRMALDVLGEVETQLREAERLKNETVELLAQNQSAKAMEKLGGCFRTWQHAQESVLKTAQLLRIDLGRINVNGQGLVQLLGEFTEQLRQIKSALENRDFVLLADILTYETTQTNTQWQAALEAMRATITQPSQEGCR